MTEKIFTAVFTVESEAYQALSEFRQSPINDDYVISQIALIKNEGGRIVTKDWLDTGVESTNDANMGGLVGMLVGILGGPLGMLLGGSVGYLAGTAKDAGDVEENASVIERVANQFVDGESGLVAFVQEIHDGSFVSRLSNWKTSVVIQEAAEVAAEVEHAQKLQHDMEKNARKQMREEKAKETKEKFEETRDKIKQQFDKILKK